MFSIDVKHDNICTMRILYSMTALMGHTVRDGFIKGILGNGIHVVQGHNISLCLNKDCKGLHTEYYSYHLESVKATVSAIGDLLNEKQSV